jgi:hypothetical protein
LKGIWLRSKRKRKKSPGGEAKENKNVPGIFCAEGRQIPVDEKKAQGPEQLPQSNLLLKSNWRQDCQYLRQRPGLGDLLMK